MSDSPTQKLNQFSSLFDTCQSVNDCLKVKSNISKSQIFQNLKEKLQQATPEDRKAIGMSITELNSELNKACDTAILKIQESANKDEFLNFDPTLYTTNFKQAPAKTHPLTQIMEELVGIFAKQGYQIATGPNVEEQWYNFTALNMPSYHPARGMQDTFYFKNLDKRGEQVLLRTQTSAVQVRFGKNNNPPFKVVVPGMVYRNEDIDATHDINFFQLECMYIDKEVNLGQLKGLILSVFEEFFNKKMTIRLRPSFFPFVNPGMEGDISCPFCNPSNRLNCKVCKGTSLIECFGAGLVHSSVIENIGLDPKQYQGLAFAFGVDRLAQFKLGVSGISQFYNSSLSFLK